MNSKIELIDEYINKANEIIEENNNTAACILIPEITSVFINDIKYIWHGVKGEQNTGCSRLKVLISKLRNLKGDIENEEKALKAERGLSLTQNLNANLSFSISLSQTINNIQTLTNDELSQDDKDLLIGKLTQISKKKKKNKSWEKAQSALKWIAEKGIEVGKVALPYIIQAIQNQ